MASDIIADIVDGPHSGRSYNVSKEVVKTGLSLGGEEGDHFYQNVGRMGIHYLFKWVENHGEE